MVTSIVRKCCICRTRFVLKTNLISVKCDMGYHSSKITVPYPTLSPLHLMISFSKLEALGLCICTRIHNKLEWILFWRNILPLSSESLLKTQTVNYPETLLPTLHVIQTLTILRLLTTVKTWRKNPVDGSRWNNWITSTTLVLNKHSI